MECEYEMLATISEQQTPNSETPSGTSFRRFLDAVGIAEDFWLQGQQDLRNFTAQGTMFDTEPVLFQGLLSYVPRREFLILTTTAARDVHGHTATVRERLDRANLEVASAKAVLDSEHGVLLVRTAVFFPRDPRSLVEAVTVLFREHFNMLANAWFQMAVDLGGGQFCGFHNDDFDDCEEY
jgi:hypothetical protein